MTNPLYDLEQVIYPDDLFISVEKFTPTKLEKVILTGKELLKQKYYMDEYKLYFKVYQDNTCSSMPPKNMRRWYVFFRPLTSGFIGLEKAEHAKVVLGLNEERAFILAKLLLR